ncbi:Na/Pi cotransporter family protein [Ponticoccus sp. SC2-23]|uniref:Na/Pi cotransporter family protein n=1 Tax=Alexandriicola marinus TaxID=2081710 RepID=UPI000FD76BD1|nr:Na/Pi cotransporter family protein [Alexandriicola marinus]MBM1221449.1 Na/Pi cotransporter family protein [Ponticoccus sp. SC6-9]MBM1226490.1 Na/Pi cotransporter family protein [Ponticoccus sp. SC6-15]MBM1230441.1 Na/Pi cotransporter family protein [Ponticoccus sp. SC6-38]MBM1234964.1 Na/Pi cotransporter family protein [Ponticoccus sp. SC6-45]MBM1239462.1 Na/Pi cotransporter family protein [Ponticoccus sp. SC6-49]MBM1243244.1 Na/Pi cotransporter family protein [Ponticoccus sp. SC2-64]MBM
MESSPIIFVLNIAAAAALLVWAVRLVRTGFERALGARLRIWLRRSTSGRIRASASGALVALILQSSTAVAVLIRGFAAGGGLGGLASLTMLLGADVGSALVAILLTSGLSVIAPLLLLSGVLTFLRSTRRGIRQIGRVLIGFALIFLALDLIRAASQPMLENPGAQAVMVYLSGDLLTAFVVSALFAWLVHSSVAAVLLYATMAGQGVLPLDAALAMVLGANLGGCLIALGLTAGADVVVRRAVWSNFWLRGGGALTVLFLLSALPFQDWLPGVSPDQQALSLHLIFNVLVLMVGLPLAGPALRIAGALIPDAPDTASASAYSSALDREALSHPRRALSCSVRELVHMCGIVEGMFRQSMALFASYDEAEAAAIAETNRKVERMSLDLRVYLAEIGEGKDRERFGPRAFELAGIGANLEAAADVIAQIMVRQAKRMSYDNLSFSEEGWRELVDFHDQVLRNLQQAVAVLMNGDPSLAEALVAEKDRVRELSKDLEERHLQRLQQGNEATMLTSSIHIDLLRALKSVNTSFAMIAYPVLLESGKLRETRLDAG